MLFQLLVPNERASGTVEVRLKVPPSILPFSYEEPAGWTRHLTLAKNGATDVVRWRGRLAKRRLHPLRVPRLDAREARHPAMEGHPDLQRRQAGRLDRHPEQQLPGRRDRSSSAAYRARTRAARASRPRPLRRRGAHRGDDPPTGPTTTARSR